MNEVLNWIQCTIGVKLEMFLGGFDNLIKAMLIVVIADYITRVMCVAFKKIPIKEIGGSEICRKFFIFLLIGIANTLDIFVFNIDGVLRAMVIIFYIAYEGKSILKNAQKLGLIIPKKLEHVFEDLE